VKHLSSSHAALRDLAFLLVDAGRKLTDAHDAAMKPLGLSRAKWRVMAYVSRTPGISQTELAAHIECSRMAITSLLDRMQSQGLIERRGVAGDRRIKAVFLTTEGAEIVREMNRIASRVLDSVFKGLPSADRTRLSEMLETIKDNAVSFNGTD